MGILEILFLLHAAIPTLHAATHNFCTSNCGSLCLTPPFKLQNTQTQDNCTYVDLKCNATLDNGTATLSLPDAGDFYVHDIAYNDLVYGPNIQLYDPGNCLMKRLMNTNLLLPAPLQAIRSQNYTFYTCPVHVNITDCNPILCLSNSTNITIATASLPIQEALKDVGVCEVIGSWVLPESEISQFELGAANAHLYLTWDDLTDCPPQYTKHTGGFKDKSSANYDPSPYMSGLVAVLCSVLITRVGGSW